MRVAAVAAAPRVADPATPDPNDALACSFCLKSRREVRKLIAGDGVCICDECVVLCHEILLQDADPLPVARLRGASWLGRIFSRK